MNETTDAPDPVPPANEDPREAQRAAQEQRLLRVPVAPALFVATVMPVAVAGGLLAFAPGADAPPEASSRVLTGGGIGTGLGWLLGTALALWVVRASRPGAKPTAFLHPVALGFLAKLFVLGVGTVLFAAPLAAYGSHEAFAICFAASSFGYQLLFQLVYGGMRQRALRDPKS